MSRHFALLNLLLVVFLLGVSSTAVASSKKPTEAASPHFEERVKVKGRAFARVGLIATVMDRSGRPVEGLTREDFKLFENGIEVPIQDFFVEGEKADRPLSVAVLLDLSESMSQQVQRVREAAKALLGALRPIDEIMVAKFNQDLVVLQPFTHDPGDPDRTLGEAWTAEGGTALFRSVEQILKDLRGRPGRKVILVVSDGLDNDIAREEEALQSQYLQDLLRLCLRTETIVYGIRPGMVTGRPPFERFVEETGGRLLYTGGDLEHVFGELGKELMSQYHLGYDIDPEVKQGKRRSIRVQVARPNVTVQTMAGFFTPQSQLETLLNDIKDDDVRLRADAAYDLGFVNEPRSTKALRKALHDKDEKVRELAAGALARLGDEEAIPDLMKILENRKEAPAVRGAALRSLAALWGDQARPRIEEYLQGEMDPGMKEMARTLLSSM